MSEQEPQFKCPTYAHVSVLGERAIDLLQRQITEFVQQRENSRIDPTALNEVLSPNWEVLEALSILGENCAIEKGLPKPKNCPVPNQIQKLLSKHPQLRHEPAPLTE